MITVVVLSGICTALAVIGIWGKDNSRYFQLDKEKKNNIHFRDYWQIMKHNKPIRSPTRRPGKTGKKRGIWCAFDAEHTVQ